MSCLNVHCLLFWERLALIYQSDLSIHVSLTRQHLNFQFSCAHSHDALWRVAARCTWSQFFYNVGSFCELLLNANDETTESVDRPWHISYVSLTVFLFLLPTCWLDWRVSTRFQCVCVRVLTRLLSVVIDDTLRSRSFFPALCHPIKNSGRESAAAPFGVWWSFIGEWSNSHTSNSSVWRLILLLLLLLLLLFFFQRMNVNDNEVAAVELNQKDLFHLLFIHSESLAKQKPECRVCTKDCMFRTHYICRQQRDYILCANWYARALGVSTWEFGFAVSKHIGGHMHVFHVLLCVCMLVA